MMASIAGGTRVGRVCSVAFGLIAREGLNKGLAMEKWSRNFVSQ